MNANKPNVIESLRKLLFIVTVNTKREVDGKKGDLKTEERMLKENLANLLGRDPTEDEVKAAKNYA